MSKVWKKGRGKLGFMQPLLGHWTASAETPMGPVSCSRTFEEVLGRSYIRLTARWEFGAAVKAGKECADSSFKGKVYEEFALIGAGSGG